MAISSKKDVSDVIGDLFEQQQLLRRDFTAYMDLQIRRGGETHPFFSKGAPGDTLVGGEGSELLEQLLDGADRRVWCVGICRCGICDVALLVDDVRRALHCVGDVVFFVRLRRSTTLYEIEIVGARTSRSSATFRQIDGQYGEVDILVGLRLAEILRDLIDGKVVVAQSPNNFKAFAVILPIRGAAADGVGAVEELPLDIVTDGAWPDSGDLSQFIEGVYAFRHRDSVLVLNVLMRHGVIY